MAHLRSHAMMLSPFRLTVIPVKSSSLKTLSRSSDFHHQSPEVFIRGSCLHYHQTSTANPGNPSPPRLLQALPEPLAPLLDRKAANFSVLSLDKGLITDLQKALIRLCLCDMHLLLVRRTDWLPRITTRVYQKVPVHSDTLVIPTIVGLVDLSPKS
jgi:hypothetical protein